MLVSFVSLLFCQVQHGGQHRPTTGGYLHLGPCLMSAVWSWACFCQVNGLLNLNEVNIFVFQPRHLEHNKARRSKGIAVLIRFCVTAGETCVRAEFLRVFAVVLVLGCSCDSGEGRCLWHTTRACFRRSLFSVCRTCEQKPAGCPHKSLSEACVPMACRRKRFVRS